MLENGISGQPLHYPLRTSREIISLGSQRSQKGVLSCAICVVAGETQLLE